jgi:5-hydroxyisourate hydrolase-like protein (transthyretin family)
MLKQTELNSRHYLFLLKVSACFLALLFGSLLLVPKASMQDEEVVVVNNMNVRVNGNYRPTPEPPKSTVRGRVFYEDTGRAVKRASIMLMGKGGGREVSGLTDNNGNFQIKNVTAGTYYAFVNAPGVVSPLAYADLTKGKDEGFEDAIESFPPIIVNGIGDLDVQVAARRGGAISGRIMYADGDPAIGVKVEILRKVKEKFTAVIPNFSSIFSMMMGGGGGGFQTDDRGVYRFAGLPNGEYIVKVTENASHSDTKSRGYGGGLDEALFGGSSLLTMFYPDVFTTEKAQIVNLVAGQEQSEINIYIPERDLFTVEGKVINSKDKTPISNVSISLKKVGENTVSLFDDFGRRQQSGSSDEQGNFNFKEMPKGTYTLVIEPSNYNYEDGEYSGNMNSSRASNKPPKPKLAKKSQEITIDDKNLSEIIIELGYGATVSGTVKTENNQEMPTTVTITAGQDNSEISSSTTVYNSPSMANSDYSANSMVRTASQKPNNDFKIEGAATGKTYLWASISDNDFYVKSAMLNGVDLLTNQIDLKEGENVRNAQFIIVKGAGTLKGTVLDDDKQPVKKAQFTLVPVEAAKRKNPNFRRSVTTKENGEFEVKAAPNEYAVVFYTKEFDAAKGAELDRLLDEAVKNAPKVTIKPNETEKISLTVPK